MNVTFEIDSRTAIPLRAIPFIDGWRLLNPDTVAEMLSGTSGAGTLKAFKWTADGPGEVEIRQWSELPGDLASVSRRIRAGGAGYAETRLQWRQDSLKEFAEDAFVWKDDLIEQFEVRAFYKPNYDEAVKVTTGRVRLWSDEFEHPLTLDFNPSLPDWAKVLVESSIRTIINHSVQNKSLASNTAPTPRQLKKNALISEVKASWPSIEKDLSEASRNGLKEAAHAGSKGGWNVVAAITWADSKGKLKQQSDRTPATPFSGLGSD